jgi:hypothetical protein
VTGPGAAAPLVLRVLAACVDAAVVVVPGAAAAALLPSTGGLNVVSAVVLWLGVEALQVLVLRARLGWTVGLGVLGLRVVDVVSGAPIGAARSALRTGIVAIGGVALGVGAVVVLVSPLFTDSRMGWHDDAADSLVVRRRRRAAVPARPAQPVPARPAQGVIRPPTTGTAPALVHGLRPELETTHPSAPRQDLWDEEDTYRPMAATVSLSDGSVHVLTGVVLVGRNPIAEPGQKALRLADKERSVSRTHLRLTVGPIAVWAEDLASTNGSIIDLPDGTQETCPPGRPVQVPVGTVVHVGDSWMRVDAVTGEPAFPDRTMKR